jgi:putative ATP-binding cassette transporter
MGFLSNFKQRVKEFASVVSPYFSSKKRKEHLKIASLWALAHLSEIAINVYFVSEAESEQVDDSAWRSATTSFGNIVFSGAMYAFKVAMSNYMIHSISESLAKSNALEGWLSEQSSVGIDFIQSSEQGKEHALSPDAPVERILTEHIRYFSKGTVKLTIENLSRLISSMASLYVIGRLANTNTSLFYLFVGGGLVIVSCKLDQKRNDMSFEITELDDTINARLTHIRERAPQILALGGEAREIAEITKIMDEKQKLASSILKQEARNNSILYVTFFGLAPLLSTLAKYAPSVLEAPPSNPVAALLFQQHVFQLLINFIIAMENYTQEAPKFLASISKIYNLQQLLSLWRISRKESQLKMTYAPEDPMGNDVLRIEQLNVSMPTREEQTGFRTLLRDTTITLTPGQYHLLGASNAGKSTTFKALVGLWPYTSGIITYSCERNKIRFIPQETFIPYEAILLEMIIYPQSEISLFARDEIIHLMNELNLKHLINLLDKKQDLRKLSRGEQQRIAIISAIIARPKVLLMDEATASIDTNNKIKTELLIKKYLPQALVIMIDHSPLSPIETVKASAALFEMVSNQANKDCIITIAPEHEADEYESKEFCPVMVDSDTVAPEVELAARALPASGGFVQSYANMFQPTRPLGIDPTSKKLNLLTQESNTKRRKSL